MLVDEISVDGKHIAPVTDKRQNYRIASPVEETMLVSPDLDQTPWFPSILLFRSKHRLIFQERSKDRPQSQIKDTMKPNSARYALVGIRVSRPALELLGFKILIRSSTSFIAYFDGMMEYYTQV